MKKTLLVSSALLLISAVGSAETIDFFGRKIQIDEGKNSMSISDLGQVLNIAPGKASIQSNNPDVPSISNEVINDNTVRFGVGDQFIDIQADPNNPNEVRFVAPDGTVLKTISKTIDANGRETVEVKDGKTGKTTSQATTNEDGSKTGTIHETFGNGQSLDVDIQKGEIVKGNARLNGKNYKKEFAFNGGNIEVLVKDGNNKLLYRMTGNDDYGKIYDGAGHLIAEGAEDNMHIYNQAAYEDLQRIMEEDDD